MFRSLLPITKDCGTIVAYCEVTTSPRKEPLVKDVGYTDVEKLTNP